MRTIEEIQEERQELVESNAALIDTVADEQRPLSDEEKTRFDENESRVAELDTEMADVREFELRKAKSRERVNSLVNAKSKTRAEPGGDTPRESRTDIRVTPRYGKLKAFPDTAEGKVRAYRSGQWLRAALFNDERAARWCAENGVVSHQEARALGGMTNTAGGSLVPDELSQTVIDLREDYGVFRQWTRVIPMGSDHMNIPKITGNTTAAFFGEAGTISEADPTTGSAELTARKMGRIIRTASELAEDAIIDIADLIARDMAWAFALKEDDVGFTGDGTAADGHTLGLKQLFDNDESTLAGSIDPAASTTTFAGVAVGDLHTMMGTLPRYARMGAAWYCSQTCADGVLNRLKAAGGGNTITTLEGAVVERFLGFPIRVSQQLPTSVTNNEHFLFFGDLSMASVLGDRRGFNISTSTEQYWTTDQIGFRATSRIGINIHSIGDATNAGPIVALKGQT